MFGIGMPELIMIMVIGLLVLGPDKLPKAIKTVAGLLRDVRQFSDDMKDSLLQETGVADLRRMVDPKTLLEPPKPSQPVVSTDENADLFADEQALLDHGPVDVTPTSKSETAPEPAGVAPAVAYGAGVPDEPETASEPAVWPRPADGMVSRGDPALEALVHGAERTAREAAAAHHEDALDASDETPT